MVMKMKEDKMGRYVAPMGEIRRVYNIWPKSLKGSDHSEDGKIILESVFGKYGGILDVFTVLLLYFSL
jgi:hypothetical protein